MRLNRISITESRIDGVDLKLMKFAREWMHRVRRLISLKSTPADDLDRTLSLSKLLEIRCTDGHALRS